MNIEKKCENCRKGNKHLDLPESINVVRLCEDKIISQVYKEKGLKPYCFKLNPRNDCERYKRRGGWFKFK